MPRIQSSSVPIQTTTVVKGSPSTTVAKPTPVNSTPDVQSSPPLTKSAKRRAARLARQEATQLVKGKSTQVSSTDITKTVEKLPTQTEIRAKIIARQKSDALAKKTEKQEATRGQIDDAADTLEPVTEIIEDVLAKAKDGRGVETEVLRQFVSQETLESSKDNVEAVGQAITGLKAVVSLKHMIENPTLSGSIDLGTASLELTGDEGAKTISTLVNVAKTIVEKHKSGELDTGEALDQISKVAEQLGKCAEAAASGESIGAQYLLQGASYLASWVPTSYLPDVSGYVPTLVSDYAPTVSSWLPGMSTIPALYQFGKDVSTWAVGDDKGQLIDGSRERAILSAVKLGGTIFGGVGKVVGLGADLTRSYYFPEPDPQKT